MEWYEKFFDEKMAAMQKKILSVPKVDSEFKKQFPITCEDKLLEFDKNLNEFKDQFVSIYTTGQKFPDTIINLKFGALVGEVGF